MMMMTNSSAGAGGNGAGRRYPFTATQWLELEQQALIYKCLASGKPIPSYLMPPLRRILDSALASTSPSLAFPAPQPSLGWGCYGMMGLGRKAADEDPEPGRCRRTDGKKWRCSKEAYPDSKYCEKHMHRGKNRSRKPVEISLATTPPAPSSSNAASATSSPRAPSSYHRQAPPAAHEAAAPYNALSYGGGNRCYAASTTRPAGGASYHAGEVSSPFHLHLDTTQPHPHPPASSYYSVTTNQRDDYAYGHTANYMEVGVGEHAFFSDDGAHNSHAAGQWQFRQLGRVEPKPSGTTLFPDGGYGINSAASAYAVDDEEDQRRRQQQHHCFVLGADLRLDRPSSNDDDVAPTAHQKPLRPFLDEWPHEKSSKRSWMGTTGGETQLSMSTHMAANDAAVTSRYLSRVMGARRQYQ